MEQQTKITPSELREHFAKIADVYERGFANSRAEINLRHFPIPISPAGSVVKEYREGAKMTTVTITYLPEYSPIL